MRFITGIALGGADAAEAIGNKGIWGWTAHGGDGPAAREAWVCRADAFKACW